MPRKTYRYTLIDSRDPEALRKAQAEPMPAWMQAQIEHLRTSVANAAATWGKDLGKAGKKKRVKKQREHVSGGLFTVSQLAKTWAVSPDTIRRLFEDEPDVIVIGNRNPRGKRRRLTLRIPQKVVERVCKRLAN